VPTRVRDLFLAALRRLAQRKPLPTNVSNLNDIMRAQDARFR
jgi:hypothetical protein